LMPAVKNEHQRRVGEFLGGRVNQKFTGTTANVDFFAGGFGEKPRREKNI
jgi:hypothetical protein